MKTSKNTLVLRMARLLVLFGVLSGMAMGLAHAVEGEADALEDVSESMYSIGKEVAKASACGVPSSQRTGADMLYAANLEVAQAVSRSVYSSASDKQRYTTAFFIQSYSQGKAAAPKRFTATVENCKEERPYWVDTDRAFKGDISRIKVLAQQILAGQQLETIRHQHLAGIQSAGHSVQVMRLCGVPDSQMQGLAALYSQMQAAVARREAISPEESSNSFMQGVNEALQKGAPSASACSRIVASLEGTDRTAATLAKTMEADKPTNDAARK